MTILSDYITANALPNTLWLDGTDSSTISVIGSTFTWLNKFGNTNYDFLQTNVASHPFVTSRGVSFGSNRRVSPRVTSILQGIESYSMIVISTGNAVTQQAVLSISKNNPSLPKLLEYDYVTNTVEQQFSILNVINQLSTNSFLNNIKTLLLSHDIKYGKTSVSTNQTTFDTYINSDKGYLLSNFPSAFYLGNSVDNIPFTGDLVHFLLFTPAISNTHLLNIGNILVSGTPVLNPLSEEFTRTSNVEIDLTSTVSASRLITYLPQIQPLIQSFNIEIDLNTLIVLITALEWDSLDTNNWNTLTTDLWNTLY